MFNIVVITPEIDHPNESYILEVLVKEYGCTIHVRKPSYDKERYKSYLQNHNHLVTHFVLHEHHVLAKEFNIKGVHLKERDRKDDGSAYKGLNIVSTSIHTIADAALLKHPFKYIFYSPLFESISKQNYGSNQTYEALKESVFELKKNTSIPIIGLGGIDEANIGLVKKSGFDGAGLLGAVWGARDPIAAIKLLFTNCR